ncbi:MAG TPA: hypothetical protein VHU81_06380 [Thermoanaerobaculia bacterium]|jgi:hypothetical protein|nr:hypothetical protein [Thermoanaerobaculia bacterium]
MAKVLYGGSTADFAVATQAVQDYPNGNSVDVLKLATTSLEVWTAGTGGTQVTDLALFTGSYTVPGSAATTFSPQANGTFLVWAEDTLGSVYIMPTGGSFRWVMNPINLGSRVRAIEAGSYVATSSVGQIGGVASLDSTGKVPTAQLPAMVGGDLDSSDYNVANGIPQLDSNTKILYSQLPVGTTTGTVLAANTALPYASLPAGVNVTQIWDGTGTTPNRVTTRTDLIVIWRSPVEPSYAAGKAIAGTDEWRNTAP